MEIFPEFQRKYIKCVAAMQQHVCKVSFAHVLHTFFIYQACERGGKENFAYSSKLFFIKNLEEEK